MKKNNFLLCLIAAAAMGASSALPSRAQQGNIYDYNSMISPGVETFQMARYDGHEHSLYSGAMTYSIPLYDYSDPDFSFPVSLEYAFDGFKPGLNSGTVGYGWRLSCGGVITREINGLADETDWDDRGNVGYLCSIRDGVFDYAILNSDMSWPFMSGSYFQLLYPQQYLFSQVKNMNLFCDMPTFYDHVASQPYTKRHYDASPDLFHFNCNGIQFDFMLNRDGTFQVFNSNLPYGEISIEWIIGHGLEVKPSRFEVSTGDGYVYYFGKTDGDSSQLKRTLEYSFNGTVWDERSQRDFMMGDDDEAWQEFLSDAEADLVTEEQRVFREQIMNSETDANYNDWQYSYDPHGTVSAWKLVRIEAPNGRVLDLNYGRTYADFSRELRYHPAMSFSSNSNLLTATSKLYQSLISTFSSPLESVLVDGNMMIRFAYSDREEDESNVNCFLAYPRYNPEGSNWDSFPLTEMGSVRGTPNENSLVQQRLCGMTVYDAAGVPVEDVEWGHFFTGTTNGCTKMFLCSVCSQRNGRFVLRYNVDPSFVFPLRDTKSVDHWGYWNGNTNLGSRDMRSLVNNNSLRAGGLYDQLNSSWKDSDFNFSVKGALVSVGFPTGGELGICYEPHSVSRLVERDATHFPYLIGNSRGLVPGGVRVRSMTDSYGDSERTTSFEYCDMGSVGTTSSSGTLLFMPRYACNINCNIGTMGNFSCMAFSRECNLTHLRDGHVGYSSVCRINPDGSIDEYQFMDYEECPDDFGASEIITKKYLSEDYDIRSADETAFICKFSPCACDNSIMRGRLRKETHWTAGPERMKQSEREYFYSCNAIGSALNYEYTNLAVCYIMTEHVFRYPALVDQIERTFDVNTGEYVEAATHKVYNSFGQESRVTVTDSWTGNQLRTDTTYGHETDAVSPYFKNRPKLAVKSERYSSGLSNGLLECQEFLYDQTAENPHPYRIYVSRSGGRRTMNILYDSHFRPVRIDYPGGRWTQYLWSADGRYLLGSTSNDSSNTTSYTWQDLVGLTSVTLPNGQSESYTYNSKGRLSERRDSDGERTVSYEYKLVNEE